jgi:hypothetical protein
MKRVVKTLSELNDICLSRRLYLEHCHKNFCADVIDKNAQVINITESCAYVFF